MFFNNSHPLPNLVLSVIDRASYHKRAFLEIFDDQERNGFQDGLITN